VQSGGLTLRVVWFSVPVGLLITSILVVNNLRDIPTDEKSGKQTLAVRLGPRGTRVEFVLLVGGAYVLPVAWLLGGQFSPWILLPLVSLPFAAVVVKRMYLAEGAALNPVLGSTAALSLGYSLLLSAGIVLS